MPMRKFLISASVAIAMACGLGAPATATLVTNGHFETSDFTGWTDPNAGVWDFVTGSFSGFTDHSSPGFGDSWIVLGTPSAVNTLSQTITDTAGRNLKLNYYLSIDRRQQQDNYFDVSWNGGVIAGSVLNDFGSNPFDWTHFQFDVLTTGSDDLVFDSRNDPGFLALDDVTLGVPEPGSLALLGTGLVALSTLRRRKTKPASP